MNFVEEYNDSSGIRDFVTSRYHIKVSFLASPVKETYTYFHRIAILYWIDYPAAWLIV